MYCMNLQLFSVNNFTWFVKDTKLVLMVLFMYTNMRQSVFGSDIKVILL